ncbi:MAG: undecaprenyl-phosphate glucose phosphotransferase [Psychromonas sp.]
MKRKAIHIADNGFGVLIKLFDFSIINLIIMLLFKFAEIQHSVVDVSTGLLFSSIFLLIGEYAGLYKKKLSDRMITVFYTLTLTTVLSVVVMELIRIKFSTLPDYSEDPLRMQYTIVWYCLVLMLTLSGRLCSYIIYKLLNRNQKIAIIGLTAPGLIIENALLKEYAKTNTTIVFYDDRSQTRFGYPNKGKYKGSVDNLLAHAKEGGIDQVYIALPMIAKKRIKEILSDLADTTVDTFIVPDMLAYSTNLSQLKMIGRVQTYSVFGSPFEGIHAVTKRMIDIVVGGLITLMILPVMAVVAIGVKLSSPGPVLFKQDRYGLGGKKIKVWKFRSMKVMENSEVVTQATKGDPRVTKFGAFIRRTSLDELPQFFNVLQGTMSIVGPRPHAVSHNEEYRKIVDNYMIRHKMKPGITGLAQISGFRGETDTLDKMEKRIEFDIRYMQSWTPFADIKIIFLTIFKGFVSETAY